MSISVVIPYVAGKKEQAKKTANIHNLRAGLDNVEVLAVQDGNEIGWVAVHNQMSHALNYDYYVYSCSDYFPCRNYLKKALDLLCSTGKGMLGFNDGKWDGETATVGMLTKEFLKSNYEMGNLFHPGYRMYGADNDLTIIAKRKGQYVYDPSIVLMEIDYEKTGGGGERTQDRTLYLQRQSQGFPSR